MHVNGVEMPVSLQQVQKALKGETRPVRFEVHYPDRSDPVLYDLLLQINFDKATKIVLVFPDRSGAWIQVQPGEWKTKDRKKVR